MLLTGKWDFPGNVSFRKMIFWECNFSGNVISWGNFIFQEIWLTGKCDFLLKCDFPGNLTSQQMWPSRVLLKSMGGIGLSISQKCDFPENVTSQELWLPGKCYFLGIVTSWELWLPRKNEFNLTFIILTMFATPPQVQYMVSIFLPSLQCSTFPIQPLFICLRNLHCVHVSYCRTKEVGKSLALKSHSEDRIAQPL